MSWKFQPAVGSFEEARGTWDALNQEHGNHVLLDSGFVSPLLRHFANGNVTLAVNDDANQRGIALLVRRKPGLWETFQPSQSPLGLILLAHLALTGEELREMTGKLPGFALQLSILQQDPDCSSAIVSNDTKGIERVDYIQTARITLTGTFEDYWKQRGNNLRHNLARRQRRLTEKGHKAELITHRRPEDVAQAIREYGLLESRGWKAKEGTAVAEDNAQGRFYREIFENFCARGEGLIYQLLIDGKVAASDLCLVRNGMLIVLKTAYDEGLNDFSPSFLMRQSILQQLFAERHVHVVEFYGRLMEWHTRWTNEIRTLYHINCFRHLWLLPLKRLARRFA
jgi:hypothetical protein